MDFIPTLREELQRKTLETLEYLTEGARKGLLSEAEFSAGIDAVWMTASGLVGPELLELATQASELSKKADRSQCRIYSKMAHGGPRTVVIRWTPGSSGLEVIDCGSVAEIVEADDPESVPLYVSNREAELLKQGFKRV